MKLKFSKKPLLLFKIKSIVKNTKECQQKLWKKLQKKRRKCPDYDANYGTVALSGTLFHN